MATVLEGEGVSEEWMREQLGEWLATQGAPIFILKPVPLEHLLLQGVQTKIISGWLFHIISLNT